MGSRDLELAWRAKCEGSEGRSSTDSQSLSESVVSYWSRSCGRISNIRSFDPARQNKAAYKNSFIHDLRAREKRSVI